jgi:ABC-type polysaccharide/polyol phosphate transport system ATPase subunit
MGRTDESGPPSAFADYPRQRDEGSVTPAIQFRNVSKKFIMHRERPRSFQELLINTFQRRRSHADTFWVLKNVSFTVEPGEALGIIGPNGAGKSTILKLIARILEPTSGEIKVNGRISALLELGAGFHPDLTGRENVFMNGAIFGLSRQEIRRKFDAIVSFAELERFIDVPVKYYSSGMYVRLGFAIAVHTEPDILLIDEVLAVGDAAFQQKCLEQIALMYRRGTTILLVSHSPEAIRLICRRALWLNNAGVSVIGETDKVISAYLSHVQQKVDQDKAAGAQRAIAATLTDESGQRWGSHEAEIVEVRFCNAWGEPQDSFVSGGPFRALIRYVAHTPIRTPTFGVAIYNARGDNLTGPNSADCGYEIEEIRGMGEVDYIIDALPLQPGAYTFTAAIYDRNSVHPFDHHHRAYAFTVTQAPQVRQMEGMVAIPCRWEHRPALPPSAISHL